MIQDPGTKRLSALAAVSRRRAGIVQRALGELEKLTPPAAIAGQYRKVLLANQSTLLAIVKVGEAAQAGDAAAVRSAKARERPTQLQLLFTAVRAGLKNCAGLPSGSVLKGLPIP